MIKKKYVLIFLSVILSLQMCNFLSVPTCAQEQANLNLYAKSAVLMDADSGRILYEKDGYTHMPNASTTKILTCILAIENGNLDDEVKVSSYAASMPKVRLGMTTEDAFYLKDLLFSLMLESHNDSAVAIAEHIGGSVEGFADMMNRKAKELGCTDSYFITPNGLDAQNENGIHGTTAADLARIMSYCIKDEKFLEITRTPNHSFSNIAGTKNYSCNNHNVFLQMMEGALSGKTGFTGNAGYCYVGALRRDDRTFIVSLLACGWPNNKTYKWSDTKQLMNYALENYHYEDVFERDKKFAELVVQKAVPQNDELYQQVTVPIELEENTLRVLKRSDEQIHTVYDIPKKLKAPVQAGEKIGSVTYYLDEKEIGKFAIRAKKTVKKVDGIWYIHYLLERFWMVKKLCINE